MLKGALPSGKHSYDSQLGSSESFKTPFSPPCLPPLFSVSLLLFLGVPTSLFFSLTLVLREHLTDVLFKDEKRGGGESKSKQRKNIHERTRKSARTHMQDSKP